MSAGNIKLNLKEFKHVSSDKDSTTLEHKKGHKLVLAHNSLSPESQEQLKALAKGGNPKLEESKKVPPKSHYDDGGIVDTVKKYLAPDFDAAEKAKSAPLPPPAYPTTAPQQKADGGEVDSDPGYLGSRHPVTPANPQKAPSSEDIHDSKSQAQNYKEQDDYSKKQNESRHLWDPSYAKGGNVMNPAKGLDFNEYENKRDEANQAYEAGLPCLNPHCKSHGVPHPNCRCYSGGERYASGGYVEGNSQDNPSAKEEYFCDMPRNHFKNCEYAKGGRIQYNGNSQRPDDELGTRDNFESEQGKDVRRKEYGNAKVEAKGRAELERFNKPNLKGLKDGGKPEDAPEVGEDRTVPHQYMVDGPGESEDDKNKGIDKEIEDASSFANPDDQQSQAASLSPEDQEFKAQRNQYGQEMQPAPQQPAPDANGYQPLPGAPNTMQQQGNYDPSKDANPVQRFQNAAQYYDYKKNEVINQGIQEGDAWMKDLQDGHIKPETYQSLFHSKDTPGKIGTLFGLLVSGAGSGLAHQSNAVMDMMKQTIDNDLQAQIHSKQNAVNYLRLGQQHEMNKAQIGNINQESNAKAIANAKTMMNWSMFHQQMQNIQAMPEGKAKQDALAQMAVMNQAIQNDNYDIWSRMGSAAAAAHVMGLSGPSNGQGSEADFQKRNKLLGSGMMGDTGKNIAANEANRHIPGVKGSASRDVTSADLSKLQAHQVMDTKIRDLMDFAEKHRGSVDPKVWAQAKQKAEETTAFYNNSLDGLGMTQGRMNWLDEQIKKNPTSIIGQVLGNNKRLQEIRDSNVMRRDTFLSGPGGLGFPKQAPQSKSGRQIEYRNGKAYYKK